MRVGEADLAQLNDARRLRAYGDAICLVVARALARAGGDPARVRAQVVEWSGDFSGLGLVALRCVRGLRRTCTCIRKRDGSHFTYGLMKTHIKTGPLASAV